LVWAATAICTGSSKIANGAIAIEAGMAAPAMQGMPTWQKDNAVAIFVMMTSAPDKRNFIDGRPNCHSSCKQQYPRQVNPHRQRACQNISKVIWHSALIMRQEDTVELSSFFNQLWIR
jgi:hypothetical protein